MCLIAIKPHGVALPSDLDMVDWFNYHDDGFGLAFQHKGRVQILKGAMNMTEMFKILYKMYRMIGNREAIKNTNIMYHFRQTSGGAVIPENCHPFPITLNAFELGSKHLKADSALAHNGIISAYSDYDYKAKSYKNSDKTDTQKFIETDLVPLGNRLYDVNVLEMIASLTESRYALMLPDRLIIAGGFITDETGMLYSNKQYMWARNYYSTAKTLAAYGYGDDYYDTYTDSYRPAKTEQEKINESLMAVESEYPCDT